MKRSFILLLLATLPLFAIADPQVSLQSLWVAEGNSGTSVVQMPMTLSAPEAVPYTVAYEIWSWSAAGGLDFIEASGSITFAPGETLKHVPVSILGDDRWEEDEFLFVTLSDPWWVYATVTIVNDDPMPVVSAENLRIPEGNATSTAFVTIRAPYPVSGWVLVRLVDGSAQATRDFAGGAEYLYFNNQSTKTFPFTILGDEEPEASERFFVEVRPASYGLQGGSNGVVTLVNDDVAVGPAEQRIPAGGSRTFTVQLGEGLAEDVTIGLSSGDRSAVSVPATLVIPAGRQSADFDATALTPGAEVDIKVVFPAGLGGGTRSVHARTYAKATLRFSPSRLNVVDGRSATVSVSLDPPSAAATTLGVRSSDRVDVPRSLTIPPGGSAPLLVTAQKMGSFTIDLRLPPVHGNELQSLYGEVIAEPETPALSMMNVSPAAGTSAGGTHVRVEGTAFDGSCWLFIGDLAAADVVVRDPQSLTAIAPPHAAGAVDVTVRCSSGSSTLLRAFTYRDEDDPTPLILEIAPPAAAPGELVTIRGLHFRPTDGVAVEAAPANLVDSAPEQHVITVPELPAGNASIFVRDIAGRTTTSGPLFSVLEARPPRIAAVAPASVAAGGELELTGEGFRSGYTFEIGGRPAEIVSIEYTRAVVRVAAEMVPGVQAVQVRNSAGVLAAIGPDVEVVAGGLIVTSAEPRCTTTDGGLYATIHGHGLAATAAVSFAGVRSDDIVVIDGTTIRVAVPPGAAGLARIAVTDDTGRTATLTNGFRYVSPFDPQGCERRARSIR